MDPTECLRRIREFCRLYEELGDDYTDWDSFVEHVEAIDIWLTKGGALPEQWKLAQSPKKGHT